MTATHWPAPPEALRAAAQFLRASTQRGRVLIVPDKDADGLTAGRMLHYTLTKHLQHQDVCVHFVAKGGNVHMPQERDKMRLLNPRSVIVVDMGSRDADPILDDVPALVIDHHAAQKFPRNAQILSAYGHEPIATSALLTYMLCTSMDSSLAAHLSWLAILGTMGDLGTSVKWDPPFPDLRPDIKRYGRTHFQKAVSLVNAPRRTPEFNVQAAWDVLGAASGPADIAQLRVSGADHLEQCRVRINDEVSRAGGVAPKFSADGRVAHVPLDSPFQIHPVIASRWCSRLKSASLQMIMVSNVGYNAPRVHFSCRVPTLAKNDAASEVNLIRLLQQAAEDANIPRDVLGEDFAKGHEQATGGSLSQEAWQLLLKALGLIKDPEQDAADGPATPKPSKTKRKKQMDLAEAANSPGQKRLESFFAAKPSKV
ncbi:hypothetical protein RI367_000209 [Sorochytrium milnesiophthora]